MSEKKIFKASDRQWERFIRAWAKDIPSENPQLPKGTELATKHFAFTDLIGGISVTYKFSAEIYDALKRKNETADIHFLEDMHSTIKDVFEEGQVDLVIRRTGLCFDFLLPPSRASDALLDLEDVYYRRWLPKHGPRIARLIFAVQGAGMIWGFWGPRMTKWVVGALGLQKLFGWVAGLRGG
jgi:hypothetical protein